MDKLDFAGLTELLQEGREIEFACKGVRYSITNRLGYWQFCRDSEPTSTCVLAPFDDRRLLLTQLAALVPADIPLPQMFDRGLVDPGSLCIL